MLRTLIALALFILLACLSATPATAQSVAPFTSVALRGGGTVVIRAGDTQSVTLLKGSARYTRIAVEAGDRLIVDNCPDRCPRDYDMKVEIVTPRIAALSVTDGGTMQSLGDFPAQDSVRATVDQGGAIDIRSMEAANVDASIAQGGRIFTAPKESLTAHVAHGGHITYWGSARIRQSVEDGGAVSRGNTADFNKPLSELAPRLPPLPAIPPLPNIQNLR